MLGCLLMTPLSLHSQDGPQPHLAIQDLMTKSQFTSAGLEKLTTAELASLNSWLVAYTVRVGQAYSGASTVSPTVIESHIEGDFEGWDGDTIFKLDNGQIWQQSSYSYYYHYAYHPAVVIYRSREGGYRMRVADVEEVVDVQRIK
jgi:hypothetical protein